MNEPAGIFERIFEPDLGPKEDVAELHKFAENYKAEKQTKFEEEKKRVEEIIENYENLINSRKTNYLSEDVLPNGIIRKIDVDPSYNQCRIRIGLTTNPDGYITGYHPEEKGLLELLDISIKPQPDGKYKVTEIFHFDKSHLVTLFKNQDYFPHAESIRLTSVDMDNPDYIHKLYSFLSQISPELRNIPIPAPSDNEPN